MQQWQLLRGDGGTPDVLCIGAHCDDIEIGCGGLLRQLCAGRSPPAVHWFVAVAPAARATESRRAARALLAGAARFSFEAHKFVDGELPYAGAQLRRRLRDLARRLSPSLILTHWHGDAHQDHRCLSELTRQTFRDHLILEYEVPKYDGDLGRPNWFVPLTAATVTAKIETLRTCFASQRDKPWFEERTFRALLRLRGMECRAPSGYAEAFHISKGVWKAS
ncbi:MAG: PIG-L family deacetylase [Proteobacteria bacterium]|nr:PIG-L family deacetylase [Pseudomonadota bacterium]